MPNYEVGSTADPMLGRIVEGYRITNLIGKGGMGAVYEAVHDGIGQRAAVKVLFPEFSTDGDAVSRFVTEARAASRVRHGGLVQIFYHGRLEDGTAYIMMEFLEGESIEQRLRRLRTEEKRMDLTTVARLGQQVASALAAVHRENIIHRDLKPATPSSLETSRPRFPLSSSATEESGSVPSRRGDRAAQTSQPAAAARS